MDPMDPICILLSARADSNAHEARYDLTSRFCVSDWGEEVVDRLLDQALPSIEQYGVRKRFGLKMGNVEAWFSEAHFLYGLMEKEGSALKKDDIESLLNFVDKRSRGRRAVLFIIHRGFALHFAKDHPPTPSSIFFEGANQMIGRPYDVLELTSSEMLLLAELPTGFAI